MAAHVSNCLDFSDFKPDQMNYCSHKDIQSSSLRQFHTQQLSHDFPFVP